MPPKKQQKGPSTKTIEKEKKKVAEDKTFGLKNKNKSKVVQNYVKQVTNQVMDGGNHKVSISILSDQAPNMSTFLSRPGWRACSRRGQVQGKGREAKECCSESPDCLSLQGCCANEDK